MTEYGKALTWDELADMYPGKARIRPMDVVFEWAETQKNIFFIHPENETIHLRNKTLSDDTATVSQFLWSIDCDIPKVKAAMRRINIHLKAESESEEKKCFTCSEFVPVCKKGLMADDNPCDFYKEN